MTDLGVKFKGPLFLFGGLVLFSVFISSNQLQQDESVQHFQAKLEVLLAVVNQLEYRIREQEVQVKESATEIVNLKARVNRLESNLHSNHEKGRSESATDVVPAATFSPRTCHEARKSGLSDYRNSGMYWIDPDGVGVGDPSIYVYCDMTTGATLVGHDSESTISIPKCTDPGCYDRQIVYPNATSKQMSVLARLSAECHQSLRINCVGSPLTLDDVDYAWWTDNNGFRQTFWSGSDSSIHTCQCGIDNDCVQADLKCNCDTNVAVLLSDNGDISLKEVLPVNHLYFGQISQNGGSHTLGRLECAGESTTEQIAISCQDLWRTGYTLNGLYPVNKNSKVELVYCDFSQGIDVVDKRIGYVDVKSASVQFDARRSSSLTSSGPNFPITFEELLINEEGGMNKENGIFTVPVSGTYVFDFSGVDFPGGEELTVNLLRNEDLIGSFYAANHGALSLPIILKLIKNEQIKLVIASPGGELYGDGTGPITHFTGFLLEENVLAEEYNH